MLFVFSSLRSLKSTACEAVLTFFMTRPPSVASFEFLNSFYCEYRMLFLSYSTFHFRDFFPSFCHERTSIFPLDKLGLFLLHALFFDGCLSDTACQLPLSARSALCFLLWPKRSNRFLCVDLKASLSLLTASSLPPQRQLILQFFGLFFPFCLAPFFTYSMCSRFPLFLHYITPCVRTTPSVPLC